MSKTIDVRENILNANDQIAAANRDWLDQAGVFALNVMASPGAGKTTLIEQTIARLSKQLNIAVVEGDIATSIDADRIEVAGASAVQINTGGNCHLDAVMLQQALLQLIVGRDRPADRGKRRQPDLSVQFPAGNPPQCAGGFRPGGS